MAAGSESSAPSDQQVRRAYRNFRFRLFCPDPANCDRTLWRQQPWIPAVSQVECVPTRRPRELRCQFLVHEPVYLGLTLHLCRGVLRRHGDEWRMRSVLGRCYGLPITPAR